MNTTKREHLAQVILEAGWPQYEWRKPLPASLREAVLCMADAVQDLYGLESPGKEGKEAL